MSDLLRVPVAVLPLKGQASSDVYVFFLPVRYQLPRCYKFTTISCAAAKGAINFVSRILVLCMGKRFMKTASFTSPLNRTQSTSFICKTLLILIHEQNSVLHHLIA
ncbi:hypothetical protein ABKV19_022782 [Rosa sericea]